MSANGDSPDGRGSGDDATHGFLSRWSRRKRETAAAVSASTIPPVEPERIPDPAGDQVATSSEPPEPEPPEPEPPPVEPPSLDLIDKDFDLAHWLTQNVPESWKLAALRRAWETDPFIHGYLNPARDYALDWNVPGGAPGYGPLTESDNVEAMVARVFGATPVADADGAKAEDQNVDDGIRRSDKTGEAGTDGVAAQHKAENAGQLPPLPISQDAFLSPNPVRLGLNPAEPIDQTDTASQQTSGPASAEQPSFTRVRRRGGGAMPL